MTCICNLAAMILHAVKKGWNVCQPPKTQQKIKWSQFLKFPSCLLIYSSIKERGACPRRLEFSYIKLGWTQSVARRQHSWTSGTALTVQPMKREDWTLHMWQITLRNRPFVLVFLCSFKLHKGWFLCKFTLLSVLHTEHQSDCCTMMRLRDVHLVGFWVQKQQRFGMLAIQAWATIASVQAEKLSQRGKGTVCILPMWWFGGCIWTRFYKDMNDSQAKYLMTFVIPWLSLSCHHKADLRFLRLRSKKLHFVACPPQDEQWRNKWSIALKLEKSMCVSTASQRNIHPSITAYSLQGRRVLEPFRADIWREAGYTGQVGQVIS